MHNVQRANVSRYHLFLQTAPRPKIILRQTQSVSLTSVTGSPGTAYTPSALYIPSCVLKSGLYRYLASATQFKSYLPYPLSQTAFQPVSRPLFWRAVRTPLSQHLFLMVFILTKAWRFVKPRFRCFFKFIFFSSSPPTTPRRSAPLISPASPCHRCPKMTSACHELFFSGPGFTNPQAAQTPLWNTEKSIMPELQSQT